MATSDEVLISSSSGAAAFIVSLVTNIALGIFSIFLISFLRRRFTYFFDSRRSDHIRNPGYGRGSAYLERPPRQSPTFFGWITDVLNLPEDVILKTAGLDAVVSLRFYLRMGVYLTVYSIGAFIILVPIQASSAENNGSNGFNALSILSLDTNDSKLWANLIFSWGSTLLLFKVLYSTWNEMIALKQKWLSNEQLLGQRMTILVSRLPKKYSTSASLYALFEELYPGQVAGAYVVHTNARLTELYGLREAAVGKINTAKGQIELKAHADLAKEEDRSADANPVAAPETSLSNNFHQRDNAHRPKMALSFCGEKTVDVIDYYTDKLKEYDDEITEILNKMSKVQQLSSASLVPTSSHLVPQTHPDDENDDDTDGHESDDKTLSHDVTALRVGFVTFSSASAVANIVNTSISENFRTFNMRVAPEPNDISWFGLTSSPTYQNIVSGLLSFVVGLMIIFYAIPIGFISALLTVESLSATFPWLEPVLTFSPVLKGIISGLLPSLALIIFMALLPKILWAFGFLSGFASTSEISIYVFKKYFLFQYINFFLIACVSSTVFNELSNILDTPSKIPFLLASGLPQSGLLFINYIMMRAFYTNIFAIVDFVDIILNQVFYWLATTPAATASALTPTPDKYFQQLPEAALIFIIAFTFGPIQPAILVFASFYFFTMFFAKRFTLTWISVNPYQTGGGFWPLLFNRIMLGVVTGQLVLLGLFALKESVGPAILMVPLIIITIWFWYRYSNLYESDEHRLTLIAAAVTDASIQKLNPQQKQALFEGFDLPSGPQYLSLLPFLLPGVMGDTTARDKTLKDLGVEDQSTTPNLQLFRTVRPENVTVHSATEGKDLPISRDVLYLPDQYHGDDIGMQDAYKKWLYENELSTNLPRNLLFDGFLPEKWVRERRLRQLHDAYHKMTQVTTATSITSPLSDSLDDCVDPATKLTYAQLQAEQNDENSFTDATTLTLEQRVLLEKIILRWQRSNLLTSHRSSVTSVTTGDNSSFQSDPTTNTISAVDVDLQDIEERAQTSSIPINNDRASVAFALQRTTTLTQLPEEISNSIPFTQQQLALSQSSGVRHRSASIYSQTQSLESSSDQLSTSPRLFTVPSQLADSQPDQPQQDQSGQSAPGQGQAPGTTATGLARKIAIPPPHEMEGVMMRWFSPETNPGNYTRVSNRVWGTTYIHYRAQKDLQKKQKNKAH